MTVADLIEELQRLPPYLPVLVEHIEWIVKEAPILEGSKTYGSRCASVVGIDLKKNQAVLDATGGLL